MDNDEQRDYAEEEYNRNIEFDENIGDVLDDIRERFKSAKKGGYLDSVHLDELRKVIESHRISRFTENRAIRMIGEIADIYEEIAKK